MFKKSRKSNVVLPPPPKPPSVEEILEDLKTFQMDPAPVDKSTTSPNNPSLESWWNMFEQLLNDLKCLETVNGEIDAVKIKLLADKQEIKTETELLKKEIEKQQQLIDKALE